MAHTHRQSSLEPVGRLGAPKKSTRRNLNLEADQEERVKQVAAGEHRFLHIRATPTPQEEAKIIRAALDIGLDVLEMKYRMVPSEDCRECGQLRSLPPGVKRRLN